MSASACAGARGIKHPQPWPWPLNNPDVGPPHRASRDYSQLASPGPFEGARALVGLVERASRFTPGLAVHGLRTALGCRGRGADCSSRSSSVPTTAPTRGAGASEPDTNMVQALVGGRVPAAAGRRRGCSAETGVRALARWRAGALACLALLM